MGERRLEDGGWVEPLNLVHEGLPAVGHRVYLCPVCGALVHQVPTPAPEDAIICRDGVEHVVYERLSRLRTL